MAHYFENDKNLKSEEKKITVYINDQIFNFYTDNGVFSKNTLDFGTRTLLENLPDNIKGDILDLGCGYGPIGIYLKKIFDVNVDMIDINLRSLKLTKKNAELNKVDINVFESDAYQNVTKKYDYIITNPPIRVGKEKLYQILFDAKQYLKENGQLWFVINKDQGAKSAINDMLKEYKVETVAKNKGFFIICAYIN